MDKTPISIIAAIEKSSRALGRENKLLWHLPKDMERFKEVTSGHAILMGRKTWESIPEKHRPLPDRENFVISRNSQYEAKGARVVGSLEEAVRLAREIESEEIFVIGGAEIYKQALPLADKLYLTLVDDPEVSADTFFPQYDNFDRKVAEKTITDRGREITFLTLLK